MVRYHEPFKICQSFTKNYNIKYFNYNIIIHYRIYVPVKFAAILVVVVVSMVVVVVVSVVVVAVVSIADGLAVVSLSAMLKKSKFITKRHENIIN